MPLIYLDHAATTPGRAAVLEAMLPFLGAQAFGNPSSAHGAGRAARAGLEAARERVAAAVGAAPRDVVFTSGGTEADNLAVLGVAEAAAAARGWDAVHLASPATEHKAVLSALHAAEDRGARVIRLSVDGMGRLDLDALDEALAGRASGQVPVLVSVMWVNNEVGTIQPIEAVAERCRAAGVPLHVDAVQALGKLPVDLRRVPCDAITISAHKIGGPKGVGALVLRPGMALHPRIHGGSQQRGVRPGTENVAGIVGFGVAAELAAQEQPATAARLTALRDALERAILAAVPDAIVHGRGAERSAAILNVSAPGTDSEAMLMHLDLAGIAAASGSACTTGAVEPSHVLTAMGVPTDVAIGAVRFSLGDLSVAEQVPRVAWVYASVVSRVRGLKSVLNRE